MPNRIRIRPTPRPVEGGQGRSGEDVASAALTWLFCGGALLVLLVAAALAR